jgi:transposase|tara:strand:+ start:83 stop:1099 length:1017 start_codon:yes stop_codon:yes gene_type:complete
MRIIEPNPENGSLADIEEGIRCSPDQRTYIRLFVLKLLLQGYDKKELSKMFSKNIRSIQNWVRLWNEGGPEALKTGKYSGRKPKIPPSAQAKLCELLRHPDEVNQTYWTARKLHGFLIEQFDIQLGYSTLTSYFRQHGFRLKVPRCWPNKQDEEKREAFRELVSQWLSDPNIDVWFCDETGFVGDPRPRRRWAHKKDKIRVPYMGTHIRQSVVGAVHPEDGKFVSLVLPYVNASAFQLFIDELADNTMGRNVYLILDNASWHKAKTLKWHHIKPRYLPPYSPDLNVIEILWLYLKEHYFNNWIAKNYMELQDRIVWAIQQILKTPEIVKSVTSCENTF